VPAPPAPARPIQLPDTLPSELRDFVDPRYHDPILKAAHILVPTILADGLDSCVIVHDPGSEENALVLIGVKVRNGDKLNHLLRDTVKDLPAAVKRDYVIAWNRDRHGKARIHEVERIAGIDTKGFLAIRDDVVFVGLGKKSLKPVKEALDGFGRTDPTATPFVQVEASHALFAWSRPLAEAVEKMSLADRNKVRARFTIEGGEVLRLRLEFHTYLLKMAEGLSDDDDP
jgi:hypothetical protein